MDTDEPEDANAIAGSSQFVPFRLLNALSDLLMLPKDMLLETSVRKEVKPKTLSFTFFVCVSFVFIFLAINLILINKLL